MNWYHEQTKWSEGHSYQDPVVTSPELRTWFMEMIHTFPAMNGPYAAAEPGDEHITDYSIGKEVIYVAFAWSMAEKSYEVMRRLAEKHHVGFFDASANDGDIMMPGSDDTYGPIDRPGNLTSIQQIKNSALPGQEHWSVQEILYAKLGLSVKPSKEGKKTSGRWWQKMGRRKK
jgi:hypothetical protein